MLKCDGNTQKKLNIRYTVTKVHFKPLNTEGITCYVKTLHLTAASINIHKMQQIYL